MAGKKAFKTLEKRLAALGFEYDRTNSKSQFIYCHATHPELAVNPGADENTARQILRQVERTLGCAQSAPKRDSRAIKQRQSAERENLREEAERLDKIRADFVRQREALLDGAGSGLTNAEIRDLERRIREIEAERREIETLMTEVPTSSRPAKHQAGSR